MYMKYDIKVLLLCHKDEGGIVLMPKHKTIEDYFNKNDILAMSDYVFKPFGIHEYRADAEIQCIDTFMETPFFLIETEGIAFIRESKYFGYIDKNGKTQREYCYEYSYGASSPDNWIPSIYYSLVD